jgi:hypothetical protein
MISFSAATPEHGVYIAEHIRPLDREELRLTGASSVASAVRTSIALSRGSAVTAFVDDRPAAVFGVAPNYLLGEGCPWMLGTPEVSAHARTLLRWAGDVVDRWLEEFPILMNEVWIGNRPAVRFLKRVGFEFAEPRLNGYGAEMALFYKRRS